MKSELLELVNAKLKCTHTQKHAYIHIQIITIERKTMKIMCAAEICVYACVCVSVCRCVYVCFDDRKLQRSAVKYKIK